jgi:hypothetical protein
MRARNRGAVVLRAAGLVLAVAGPANAQSQSTAESTTTTTPASQQIVTATAQKSLLKMPSGYSHYLYVAGSSANAVISQASFQDGVPISFCGTPKQVLPVGRPRLLPSDQGAIRTSGSVAAMAGVATDGYSVRQADLVTGSFDWLCGTIPTGESAGVGFDLVTGKVGGLILILVGTEGIGNLGTPTVSSYDSGRNDGGSCSYVSTLRNVTVSQGQNEAASVAIYTADAAPESTCAFWVNGSSFTRPGDDDASAGLWANAYLLVPNGK